MKHKKKKVTLETLSQQIEVVSEKVDDTKSSLHASIEGLAGMTKREFDAVHAEIDELRSEHGGRLANLERNYHEMAVVQEDIKEKLDNAAYKFEVKELQTRVERLEQKRGIAAA